MIPPFASVEEFEPSGVLPDSLDSSLIWSDSPDTSPSILTSLDFESVLEPTLEPCYSMSGVDGCKLFSIRCSNDILQICR